MSRYRYLPLFLGACLFCSAPSFAQPKKPAKAAPAPTGFPLPLVLGAAVGGLILGGALGFALKKPAPIEEKNEDGPEPLFDEAPFPFALLDSREKITRANAAFSRYFGLTDATGSAFPEFLHPDNLAQGRTLIHEIFGGDRAEFSFDSRLFRHDGALLHAQVHGLKQGKGRRPDALLLSIEDATSHVEANSELSGAREAIRALYEVISGDKTRDLDSKIKSLLSMGCGRFELPIGVLGQLNGENFETLFVQSPDRRVRPAMTLDRRDTDTVEAQLLGLATMPHRGNWKKHPFVSINQGVAYLGAPVLIDGEMFGMLSFSSTEAREKPFGGEDTELLQLMAEWVGGEIERENHRTAIENQQKALLEANNKLEALATHDPLTGAKNRRAFNEKLEEEWSRATRYGTPLSLVLMDVDKFKSYNDTFGHPAGDEVLKKVARTLMAAVRTTDFFARYGGEEFVLILPNTDADGAMILAERLRQKIEGAGWKERDITTSMGIASSSADFKAIAELTQAADTALYASKENGRNRVTHVRNVKAPEVPATSFEFQNQ